MLIANLIESFRRAVRHIRARATLLPANVGDLRNPYFLTMVVLILFISATSIFVADLESRRLEIQHRDPDLNDRIAEILASKCSPLLQMGNEAIVVLPSPKPSNTGMVDRFQTTFKQTLQTLRTDESIAGWESYDPERPSMHLSQEFLAQMLTKYPKVEIIVSFAGAPRFSKSSWGTTPPKIMAYTGYFEELPELIEAGQIELVVIPISKLGPSITSGDPDGQRLAVIDRNNINEFKAYLRMYQAQARRRSP